MYLHERRHGLSLDDYGSEADASFIRMGISPIDDDLESYCFSES